MKDNVRYTIFLNIKPLAASWNNLLNAKLEY